jgi:hypothetical protein
MIQFLNRAVDPMTGGLWFKLRTPLNFVICILLCAVVVAGLSFLVPIWAADLVAIGLVYYIFVVFLNKRPIGLRCDNCHKVILSNTPWVCGFCRAKNEDADNYPFIHRCKKCSAVPKAYKCHHAECGALVFLTSDTLRENYASCLNSPAEVPPPAKSNVHQEQKQEMEHSITMTQLDMQLAALRKQREIKQPRTVLEEKRESLDKHYAGVMAAQELATRKKAEVAIVFKDDPENLQKAVEAIDDWLRRHT